MPPSRGDAGLLETTVHGRCAYNSFSPRETSERAPFTDMSHRWDRCVNGNLDPDCHLNTSSSHRNPSNHGGSLPIALPTSSIPTACHGITPSPSSLFRSRRRTCRDNMPPNVSGIKPATEGEGRVRRRITAIGNITPTSFLACLFQHGLVNVNPRVAYDHSI